MTDVDELAACIQAATRLSAHTTWVLPVPGLPNTHRFVAPSMN